MGVFEMDSAVLDDVDCCREDFFDSSADDSDACDPDDSDIYIYIAENSQIIKRLKIIYSRVKMVPI
jgi:hypothetical protein